MPLQQLKETQYGASASKRNIELGADGLTVELSEDTEGVTAMSPNTLVTRIEVFGAVNDTRVVTRLPPMPFHKPGALRFRDARHVRKRRTHTFVTEQ